jgi:rhodanese-related sulfurtransferase
MLTHARTTVDRLLAESRAQLERLEPDKAMARVRAGAVLVDIRTDAQRAADGLVPGAVYVPRNVLEWRADPESGHSSPPSAVSTRR